MCQMNPFLPQPLDACAQYDAILSGLPVPEVRGGR